MPLIVWIHGGGWTGGDKSKCPAVWLTQKGFAVASLNYRLSQEATFPAQIQDCKAAIRWLRVSAATYGIDPDRFGVWGASAGGHLAALLGTSGDIKDGDLNGPYGPAGVSSRVQAVCDWFGPVDLLDIYVQPPMPGTHINPDTKYAQAARLIGGSVPENSEQARRANPLTYVSTNPPPFLIMHGDQDLLVPHRQSELLEKGLRNAGGIVQLITIQGAGHGFGGPDIMDTVLQFFARYLRNEPAGR